MFQIGSALAPNMASLVVFRFLGGTCAGSPLALTAAVLVDIWEPRNRAYAFSWFALGPFVGPIIAPVVSGYISVSGQDWRLAFWVLSAFAGACFLIIIFTCV